MDIEARGRSGGCCTAARRRAPPVVVVRTLAGLRGALGEDEAARRDLKAEHPTLDLGGAFALVADRSNHAVRRIDLTHASHTVSNVAGAQCSASNSSCRGFEDGVGTAARFNYPRGIAIDPLRASYALVADTLSQRVRKIDLATRAVTKLAGTGSQGAAAEGKATTTTE